MFCVNCGNQLEEEALFCSKCGQKVIKPNDGENNAEDKSKEANAYSKTEKKRKWFPVAITVMVVIAVGIIGFVMGKGKVSGVKENIPQNSVESSIEEQDVGLAEGNVSDNEDAPNLASSTDNAPDNTNNFWCWIPIEFNVIATNDTYTKNQYVLDEKGMISTWINNTKDEDGESQTITNYVYTYDENGIPVSVEINASDEEAITIFDYSYDEDGYIIGIEEKERYDGEENTVPVQICRDDEKHSFDSPFNVYVFDDGTQYLSEELVFDHNGYMIHETFYDENGTNQFQYDIGITIQSYESSLNKPSELAAKEVQINGELDHWETYEYNDRGLCVEHNNCQYIAWRMGDRFDDNLVDMRYEYDESDRVKNCKMYLDGTYLGMDVYEYNENGNVSNIVLYDEIGDVIEEYSVKYQFCSQPTELRNRMVAGQIYLFDDIVSTQYGITEKMGNIAPYSY